MLTIEVQSKLKDRTYLTWETRWGILYCIVGRLL